MRSDGRTMIPGLCAVLACVLAVPAVAQDRHPWDSSERRATQYHSALATADGVRATLYRYLPPAGPPSRTILLLPNFGMTRHALDFDGAGLAPFLQRAGWEVYVVEWRGAGRSEVPFGGYALEDLLDGDAEAAFARATLERQRIAVGGVGLGATFALALAARHPDEVSAVLAMQPLVAPDLSCEALALWAVPGAEVPPWVHLASATAGKMFENAVVVTRNADFIGVRSLPAFHDRTWFDVLYANDGSIPAESFASMRAHVLAPVPARALGQLAEAARERRLTLGGKAIAEVIGAWKGPTVLVFAPRDNLVHPEFAVPVRDILPKHQQKVIVLDALANLKHDYGHLGMLLGRDAPMEVFGPASKLLDEVAR